MTKPYNVLIIPSISGPKELETEYKRHSCGHWFDEETMAFFNSKITDYWKDLGHNRYLFISSEQYGPIAKRYYTVRRAELDTYIREDGRECLRVSITNETPFCTLTKGQARKVADTYI